jgi:hypothetical protein
VAKHESVRLLYHVEAVLKAQEKYIEGRFDDQQKAVGVARAEMDRTLLVMNEIRGTLKDQAERLVTKETLQALFDGVQANINRLNEKTATSEGKASQLSVIASFIMGSIGVLTGIGGLVVAYLKKP